MNRLIKYFLICLWMFSGLLPCAYGQQNMVDSLNLALKTAKHDTTKLRLLGQLSEECDLNDILNYALPAVELADKLLQDKSVSNLKSEILNQKASALNNIGFIYMNHGDISNALDYYSKSLRIQEEIGDRKGLAGSLSNIGSVYNTQGDLSKALEYYGKSLKIMQDLGNKNGVANLLNNIGAIYKNQGNIAEALNFYERSLKIREETGDKKGIANSLNNIGSTYNNRGDIATGLEYFQKSLKIRREIGDKHGIAFSLNNIAAIYFKMASLEKIPSNKLKKHLVARAYADSSLLLSRELGFPENIRNSEQRLMMIDSARGNYVQAFEHYKQYILYRDSINNAQTQKASIKSQLKYEFEKKEAILKEQQEKERAIAEEKDRFQQIVIWSVAGGLFLVVLFTVFVIRSLRITNRQKTIIEEKQKEILDSIRYAKRIQTALITPEKYIDKNLNKLQNNQ